MQDLNLHFLTLKKDENFKDIQSLEGHSSSVTCVAVLPNGNIISGSGDNTLKEWDKTTGLCLKTTLTGHSRCVAVLPNGNIISVSGGTLKEWDKTTGQCRKILTGSSSCVSCVAVLRNGNIISGSHDTWVLEEWDMTTGQCECQFVIRMRHRRQVTCVAVLPNGNILSGSKDQTLKEWDMTTGQCLKTLTGHSSSVTCVAVLPNGNIISGSEDATLKEWDMTTGLCLKTLTGHSSYINCVAVLPNGNIISGSNDATLKIWESPYLRSFSEMKKNSSVLAQACRTKTSFFALLPNELNRKIIADTGNADVHDQEDRDKSAVTFYEQVKNEHGSIFLQR